MRAALRRGVVLLLLIQYPQEAPGFSTMLWRFWQPLHQEFPDLVHAYYREGGVYIHSKSKVIDDSWMMVGSPNVNYRSTTSDAELAAAVVDRAQVTSADGVTVGRSVLDWRLTLWEDATGIVAATWRNATVGEGLRLWAAAAARPSAKIGQFVWEWGGASNVPAYEAWADEPAFIDLADPDGRCS